MKNLFPNLMAVAVLVMSGCSSPLPTGPVTVKVIKPVANQRCQAEVAPVQLTTLTSLSSLQGTLGRVVLFPGDIDSKPQTLETGQGFLRIDTQFLKTNDGFIANDYRSLLGASLYYATEVGYQLHARLNSAADFISKDSNFASKVFIIADANRADSVGGPYVKDNAEYYPHKRGDGTLVNYLISYPNDEVTELPLGLNLGIMVHEYTHLVFHNLFYEPGFQRHHDVTDGLESELTLAAIDEGLADYFGYLATSDPSYFLCSFPGEARDLSRPKGLSAAIRNSWATGDNYDSHEGGAVFAAINYEIGNLIGHEENGKLLSQLMQSFLTCGDLKGANGALKVTFEGVARCHASISAGRSSQVQGIYNKYLGGGR